MSIVKKIILLPFILLKGFANGTTTILGGVIEILNILHIPALDKLAQSLELMFSSAAQVEKAAKVVLDTFNE